MPWSVTLVWLMRFLLPVSWQVPVLCEDLEQRRIFNERTKNRIGQHGFWDLLLPWMSLEGEARRGLAAKSRMERVSNKDKEWV